ncbi:sporulation killing factor [Insulibacter thermoxylanivorax]|uniref:sporulation killing factor n=1 Tax=Insulibacter thermoxylanivorax TaxID=2749268 RepID=UPI0019103ECC|nr:sporulation killing factor [Insulibacter thermoxylanivorax]
MSLNNKQWEPAAKKSLLKSAGTGLVKSAGCMGCWAAKSIPMTRVCWLPHPVMRAT